ncbi:FecCD family ABC transporter permease [Aquipuribacter sp. SD81]|uniref:FecCD family ABC transporter permease n=1 Tax=Aquipuribacter sp. SD81 TaxID=3127703 RepID=UPI003017A578
MTTTTSTTTTATTSRHASVRTAPAVAPGTGPTSPSTTTPGPEQLAAVVAAVRRGRTTGRARAVVVGLLLLLGCVVTFAASLVVGEFALPLREVALALVGRGGDDAAFVVGTLRLPRAVTAVLVGAAFGLGGIVFQSLARNPLASPDVIGVSAGSTVAAVGVLVAGTAFGVQVDQALLTPAAFVGGLLATTAIYLLAWRRGLSAYRLVLVGIAVAAMLNAVTSYLLTRAEITDAQRAFVWLTGSVNGRGWDDVRVMALALVVLVPLLLVLASPLRTLQLGDDTARGVGVRVEPSRAALVVVALGCVSVATAVAGPVAFVAFVAGPVARRLVGTPLTVVPAALTGALLVLLSDLVARTALAPTELPVGIVTGLVGAPYLLWLLTRANRLGRTG